MEVTGVKRSRSECLKRLQWGDYQGRTMLCLDHHGNQNAANGSTIIFTLARSFTTSVLISLRLQMFQWSFDATHMKRTYRCARACDARCQFWRPQAPTLASYRADAGFAEDLSLERLPGKRQPKPNKFSSNDREKQRNKQGAHTQKRMWRLTIFFTACVRKIRGKQLQLAEWFTANILHLVFRGTSGTTANTTNQRGVINNFFGHWISRGKKKANSFSYWTWQTTELKIDFWKSYVLGKKSIIHQMLLLASHWASPRLVCCRESAEIGHFNVVMETRCDRVTNALFNIERACKRTCLNFFNQTVILCSLFPSQPLGDILVTSPSVWEVKTAAVWVKSPLAQISELCLLGPAVLLLPHIHTWRALQRSPLGFIVTLCRTRCSAVDGCCCSLLLAQCLKGPIGTFWLVLLLLKICRFCLTA